MAKNILVASGKGGTGKSVFAVNMGALLARRGFKVLLIDADQGHGSLDLYLGVQNSCVYNIQDVAEGLCTIAQGITDTDIDTLKLIPASPDEEDIIFDARVARILNAAFDYIITDAPSTHSKIKELFAIADTMVITSTCDYASLRSCDRLSMIAKDSGITDTMCVLTKARVDRMGNDGYISFQDIKYLLHSKVIGIIPQSDSIEESVNSGKPAILGGEMVLLDNFVKICERIINRKL